MLIFKQVPHGDKFVSVPHDDGRTVALTPENVSEAPVGGVLVDELDLPEGESPLLPEQGENTIVRLQAGEKSIRYTVHEGESLGVTQGGILLPGQTIQLFGGALKKARVFLDAGATAHAWVFAGAGVFENPDKTALLPQTPPLLAEGQTVTAIQSGTYTMTVPSDTALEITYGGK